MNSGCISIRIRVPILVLGILGFTSALQAHLEDDEIILTELELPDCATGNLMCKNETVENAGVVPGKAGEMGMLLCRHMDDLGNALEIWCLKANADHLTDFGYLYRGKGVKDEDAVWIGACTFLKGQNKWGWNFTDANKNGKPDNFGTITWKNTEPYKVGEPPNERDGRDDWFYRFDSTKPDKNLVVSKTEGKWVLKRNAQQQPYWDWEVTKSTPADNATDAPKNFKDLKWNDTKITLASGEGGIGTPAVTLAAALNGTTWNYTLHSGEMSGSGTELDPFYGMENIVNAGDEFTIAGTGITNAFVSGMAASTEYGGWIAEDIFPSVVTYRATSDAVLSPGFDLTGFSLMSTSSAGTINWGIDGLGDYGGISGVAIGPVPEPPTLDLIALGSILSAILMLRRLRGQ